MLGALRSFRKGWCEDTVRLLVRPWLLWLRGDRQGPFRGLGGMYCLLPQWALGKTRALGKPLLTEKQMDSQEGQQNMLSEPFAPVTSSSHLHPLCEVQLFPGVSSRQAFAATSPRTTQNSFLFLCESYEAE